jgi:hypothetical protein
VTSRRSAHLIFSLGFTALVVALHLPLLKMPFHWDEAGQFVPAALDLYRDGAWVAHSTAPNVHPPGLAAVLAAVWRVAGFSILSARLTMLAIAGLGVYLSFLLAVRLSRGAPGAPAFAAVLLLLAAPLFQAQSMLVLLDLPAMTLTVLAVLLFLDQRYALCAAVCTGLVLVKETAISTPAVFAAWLWFRDRRRREALYFAAPAAALAAWLLVLRSATGSMFGNAEFAAYNVTGTLLNPWHLLYAVFRRAYFLLFADGHWIGALALYFGRNVLRGREWTVAGAVAGAQLAVVTLFGGAVLERYLLPVLPFLYAAMAAAATVYTHRLRLLSHAAMLALLLAGWVWDPPFTAPLENNLSMVDFVRLQETAAEYVERHAPEARIATTWPLTNALAEPDFGYVKRPLRVVRIERQQPADFAALDPASFDLAVIYSRGQRTPRPFLDVVPRFARRFVSGYVAAPEPPSPQDMQRAGLAPVAQWSLGGEWLAIYRNAR